MLGTWKAGKAFVAHNLQVMARIKLGSGLNPKIPSFHSAGGMRQTFKKDLKNWSNLSNLITTAITERRSNKNQAANAH